MAALKAAADRNDRFAQLRYATVLQTGDGFSIDLPQAAKYLKLAADQNLRDAQYQYGLCLETGSGLAIDLATAAEYYKLAADQNHPQAQFRYGFCLSNGEGVETDYRQAAHYYTLAADQNVADAQFNYGFCLSRGEGVDIDLFEAARYFKLAADQNLAQGQLQYGICLSEGEGVSVDLVEAARYFKMAADQNLPDGQFNYGFCLETGKGVDLDLVKAAGYYRLAADQDNPKGQFRYGLCLANGTGVEIDLLRAAHYYKLSADQNLAEAQFQYGCCLADGKGVKVDPVEAAQFVRLAADQGLFEARFNYAVALAKGDGVNLDLLGAARYFRLAAWFFGQHDDDWEDEFGVVLDSEVAGEIYERSADVDAFCGLDSLGTHLEVGDYGAKDLALAVACYRFAATRGDSDAQANYGFCLEHGLGVDQNPSEAVEFYKRSMLQHNPVGTSHYALSVHFGWGCCEDLEAALDHYDFIFKRPASLLAANSARCLRGLNKRPPPKADLRPEIAHPTSINPFDPVCVIMRYRVDPIVSLYGSGLGLGGFVLVTRERDPRHPETLIAVKHILRTEWRYFVREVDSLARARHPCVVQLIGWSRIGSRSFQIWMKLAVNGPIADHFPGGRRAYLGLLRDPTRQACLLCDIVLGMKHVHACGIMHRDLKPANILLDENWRGLIADFGCSRLLSSIRTHPPEWGVGTFAYAAPEQLEAQEWYTEKVDVFSFGLVAYEIVRGVRAYSARAQRTLPELPLTLGPLMQNLIRRCWSLNPAERPSFQDILQEFSASGWAILPHADPKVIEESVLKVIRLESHSRDRQDHG
jgi:TPR repeat protein/serine/threonine protein kinase